MSYERAQRMYDNQTPWDNYKELPDDLIDAYKDTEEYQDWIMEEAGNGDWVLWEERNYDAIVERATEYWGDQHAGAADDYTDHKCDR